MAARSESLDRIKKVIDIGLSVTSQLEIAAQADNESAKNVPLQEYGVAVNGALLTAMAEGAEQLEKDLREFSNTIGRTAEAIRNDTFDYILWAEAILQLAEIQNRYVELKAGIESPTSPET